jgi:hypothetical protein
VKRKEVIGKLHRWNKEGVVENAAITEAVRLLERDGKRKRRRKVITLMADCGLRYHGDGCPYRHDPHLAETEEERAQAVQDSMYQRMVNAEAKCRIVESALSTERERVGILRGVRSAYRKIEPPLSTNIVSAEERLRSFEQEHPFKEEVTHG